jgi:hypothetical protein
MIWSKHRQSIRHSGLWEQVDCESFDSGANSGQVWVEHDEHIFELPRRGPRLQGPAAVLV